MGGIVAAIETGWLHRKISDYARSEHEMIEQRKIKIVGHNCFNANTSKVPDIDIFRYPAGVADRQCQKLRTLRSERDGARVEDSLRALQEACKQRQNVFPYCLEAARANATEGEIARVFRQAFGSWTPPMCC